MATLDLGRRVGHGLRCGRQGCVVLAGGTVLVNRLDRQLDIIAGGLPRGDDADINQRVPGDSPGAYRVLQGVASLRLRLVHRAAKDVRCLIG